MPKRAYTAPRDWTAPSGAWPNGPWRADTPRYARVTAAIAAAIEHHRGNRSLRDIAARAGIAHTTLSRLITGQHVPDIGVITALEDTLDAALWPAAADPEEPDAIN